MYGVEILCDTEYVQLCDHEYNCKGFYAVYMNSTDDTIQKLLQSLENSANITKTLFTCTIHHLYSTITSNPKLLEGLLVNH